MHLFRYDETMRLFYIFLLLGIVTFGAIGLSGGVSGLLPSSFLTSLSPTTTSLTPTPTASVQYAPVTVTTGPALSTLQFNSIVIGTITPTPTPSGIDFSSASLDWDDVKVDVIGQCSTLSTECENELSQAVFAEVGETNGKVGIYAGSRAALCAANAACQKQGYSAYNGSTSLPVYIPTVTCQNEFSACVTDPAAVKLSLPEIFNVNCDASDNICN